MTGVSPCAVDARRLHLLMKWVVPSSILSRFGPRSRRWRLHETAPPRRRPRRAAAARATDTPRTNAGLEPPAALEKLDDNWTVGVAPSDGTFTQLSFVNSICTSKGGQHVDAVAKKVCDFLAKAVKKKNKGQEVKPAFIKAHLCVYVDALIVNPAFDSQTKETLTTKERSFGSKVVLPDKFLKAVEKSGVVDRVLAWTKFKQDEQLKRKGGSKKMRLTGITKLDDANSAGGAKGKDCTLILTEGDSAKALAVSGLGVVGRDLYGVFPLKGKPLNVREASHAAIMKNEEVSMRRPFDAVAATTLHNAGPERRQNFRTALRHEVHGREHQDAALRPPHDHDGPGPRRVL